MIDEKFPRSSTFLVTPIDSIKYFKNIILVIGRLITIMNETGEINIKIFSPSAHIPVFVLMMEEGVFKPTRGRLSFGRFLNA